MAENNRKLYLDVLRIVACFLVIFNHLPGYTAYQSASGAIKTFGYMFLTMITRLNVPVFFMLSGSLLLSKDISYKALFWRVLRIVGAIAFATIALYLATYRKDLSGFTFGRMVRLMLSGKLNTIYWYLYAYLGFLIVQPFMRSIAVRLGRNDVFAMLIGHFCLWTVWTIAAYILECMGKEGFTVHKDFVVPFMSIASFFYPLLGYYFDRVVDINKFTGKKILLLCGVCLVGIVISSCLTYHQGVRTGFTQRFVQTFDYITAICAFVVVKFVVVKSNNFGNNAFLGKILPLISSLTFGIYLLEPILKLHYKVVTAWLPFSQTLLVSIFWCVFAMVLCGATTYILKKIPVIKKIF